MCFRKDGEEDVGVEYLVRSSSPRVCLSLSFGVPLSSFSLSWGRLGVLSWSTFGDYDLGSELGVVRDVAVFGTCVIAIAAPSVPHWFLWFCLSFC